jgi:hypothetical protein
VSHDNREAIELYKTHEKEVKSRLIPIMIILYRKI